MCTSQGRRSWFLTPCGIVVWRAKPKGVVEGARGALFISRHTRARALAARLAARRRLAQHGARTRRAPRRMCARATATPHARARETETRGERTRPLGRGASTSPPAQQEPAIACTRAGGLMLTRCYPLVTNTEAREVLERVNTSSHTVNPLYINTSLVTCWSHICPLVRHWCASLFFVSSGRSVSIQTSSGSLRSPTSTPPIVPNAASYGRAGLLPSY
jgi:hypothetical protein